MNLQEAIEREAYRRHPVDHEIDDPFGATGVARSDPYGYEETARQAFTEGGAFALSLGGASPARGSAIVAVKRAAENIIERTRNHIGTHSVGCYEYHLPCFAHFVLNRISADSGEAER